MKERMAKHLAQHRLNTVKCTINSIQITKHSFLRKYVTYIVHIKRPFLLSSTVDAS